MADLSADEITPLIHRRLMALHVRMGVGMGEIMDALDLVSARIRQEAWEEWGSYDGTPEIVNDLRQMIGDGDDYHTLVTLVARAAMTIERQHEELTPLRAQAAQLSALRTGADTEDLHAAAADRITRLEAESDTLHATAEGWRKRADAAEALVAECEPCLRDGETPRQRIDRERADVDAVGKLYYREKAKAENARRRALEEAAKWVDQRLSDYVADHGVYDPETGATEFPGTGEEYCGEMEEIAAAIRALADKPAAGGDHV